MELNNAASLGAAICAAVGSGAYAGFDAAIDAMVRPAATFAPDQANRETYAKLREILPGIAQDLDRTNRLIYSVAG
jgi:sugar (pentulose or hexulose) kinase